MSTKKTFSVNMRMVVKEEGNILSASAHCHEEDIEDLIKDTFYDIDDAEVYSIAVRELDHD